MNESGRTEMIRLPLGHDDRLLSMTCAYLKVVCAMAMFAVLAFSVDVRAGGEFDFVGYSAHSLLQSVAQEINVDKEIQLQRTKSEYCNKHSPCSAINIVGPFEKTDFLSRSIVAVAKPCTYAKTRSFFIKNPDLSTAKSKPQLDGKDVFCRDATSDASVVLNFSDPKVGGAVTPITIIIKSSEYARFGR